MEGQENIQEILTKQLVLCQYLCALSILRRGTAQYIVYIYSIYIVYIYIFIYMCRIRRCGSTLNI